MKINCNVIWKKKLNGLEYIHVRDHLIVRFKNLVLKITIDT